MNKLTRLHVLGLRRLADVDLRLRPLTVLIGPNGVGKTSLLDAVSLLSASATGRLSESISAAGGVDSLLTRGGPREFGFEISMEVPGYSPLDYSLVLRQPKLQYEIVREQLSQDHGRPEPFKHIVAAGPKILYHDGNKLAPPNWDYEPFESALSQVPKMFKEPEEFRKVLGTVTSYHVLPVGPRAAVKLPQPMKPASLPGGDGEDLVPLLYSLREGDRDRFDAIVDTLRAAFPTLEELAFPPVAAGTMAMTWKDRNFSRPIYMHELSEGMLRFLWLTALLQSPSLSTVTMIDEPEVSMHPELLGLFADLLRAASERTQLIVATHSDRLVRFLQPSEVVVMDAAENGLTLARWADEIDIDKWLAEYSLDEVWRMGELALTR